MLCGIGGRTIAEAKERLSYQEFCGWLRYRNQRGSLNPGLRTEWAGALLASLYANSHSKRGGMKLYDFAPHINEPPVSLESAMEVWK